MKLHRKKAAQDQEDSYEEAYFSSPRPRRFGRQARETIVMCLLAGLIAGLVWGIYKWTNAVRYAPPVYSPSAKGDQ